MYTTFTLAPIKTADAVTHHCPAHWVKNIKSWNTEYISSNWQAIN